MRKPIRSDSEDPAVPHPVASYTQSNTKHTAVSKKQRVKEYHISRYHGNRHATPTVRSQKVYTAVTKLLPLLAIRLCPVASRHGTVLANYPYGTTSCCKHIGRAKEQTPIPICVTIYLPPVVDIVGRSGFRQPNLASPSQ